MRQAARISDYCGGGIIVTGASSVIVEGFPLAHIGSFVSTYWYDYLMYASYIITGSSNVIVEGKPVARIGDTLSYSVQTVTTGSSSVTIGG